MSAGLHYRPHNCNQTPIKIDLINARFAPLAARSGAQSARRATISVESHTRDPRDAPRITPYNFWHTIPPRCYPSRSSVDLRRSRGFARFRDGISRGRVDTALPSDPGNRGAPSLIATFITFQRGFLIIERYRDAAKAIICFARKLPFSGSTVMGLRWSRIEIEV